MLTIFQNVVSSRRAGSLSAACVGVLPTKSTAERRIAAAAFIGVIDVKIAEKVDSGFLNIE